MCRQIDEIEKGLWGVANKLRNNMDANEFKDYILPVLFIKDLSLKCEEAEEKQRKLYEKEIAEGQLTVEELEEALPDLVAGEIYYYIGKEYRYNVLREKAEKVLNDGSTVISMVEELDNFIKELTKSTQCNANSESYFKDLFQSMSLTNVKLGVSDKDRSITLSKLIVEVDKVLSDVDKDSDVLGIAYEYLLANFASNAGKKAGEFYTPKGVSKLLAKLVSSKDRNMGKIYDPTCGSGSLLLQVAKYAQKEGKSMDNLVFYGQELNSTTYNLAKMNMLLHNVKIDSVFLEQGDTLLNPKHIDSVKGPILFDTIVANPPYSAHWEYNKVEYPERFISGQAPKTKADFAFIQHMIYHLEDDGMLAVVLPHGVLFRGGQEGKIRKHLIDSNLLDAVIGLPANLFYGTTIPTCILIFKKGRENKDILFIDASNEFEKGKNQNELTDEHIQKIEDTYNSRAEIEKYSSIVSIDEIKENKYNLNIPRYVDTFEEEEEIDLEEVVGKIAAIDREIAAIDKELEGYLAELGL